MNNNQEYRCPGCGSLLSIDRESAELWRVRCPRYACFVPIIVHGSDPDLLLKTYIEEAAEWKRINEMKVLEEMEKFNVLDNKKD